MTGHANAPLVVLRGNPDDDELVSLVVALLTLRAATGRDQHRKPGRPGWRPPGRFSAPGAWRSH